MGVEVWPCLSAEFVERLRVDVARRHPGERVDRRVALAGHGVVVAHRLVVAAGLKEEAKEEVA